MLRCFLFLPIMAFAGQSLVLTPGVTGSIANPNLPENQSWRVEFQLHGWTLPPQGEQNDYIFYLNGTGLSAAMWPDGRLALTELRDPISPAQPCFLSLNGRQNVLVRFQKDVSNLRVVCEIWNSDGTGYQQDSEKIASIKPWELSGGTLGSANTQTGLAFLRVFSTIDPDGARPPVTADVGDLLNLTFDAGTNPFLSLVAGVSYVPTPGQNPVAFVKTFGAPAWNNWVSLRAGFPAQLDGSRSYSLADASSQVTYQWAQVSGPTTVLWSDTTSATPTIQGLIFGTYTFLLTVKDINGNTASTTLQMGAVATDTNGVVVQADPNADKLFGPMIAFGQNPWGYADERALKATTLRSAAYDATGLTTPLWEVARPGTVTYNLTPASTSITADVSFNTMSMQVSDATRLDLTTFPTRILLGSIPFEEIRICSATGNTLQVCYDGRGFRSGSPYHLNPKGWTSGTPVYQIKIMGTGTQFMTDFCPSGPGWSGPISYKDGTVTVTPGSSSVVGHGTSWANTNAGGRAIRIQGTYNGGIPFVFQAYVAAVNGTSSVTLTRPWPSDADSGSFTYSLINADTRNLTPHYVRLDGTDGIIYFFTSGCESDTSLYLYLWWDNGITGLQINKQYSYMDGMGFNGDFGVNYYDEVLAHYALYYRSGWTPARDAARKIGDNWLDYPEVANGDAGGAPRRMSITGVVAGAVLDGRTKNWSGLRTFANRGVNAIAEDCNSEVRENAYELSWPTFAALFDPIDTGSPTDPNQRSYWKNKLAAAAARDASCSGSDHSFKTGFYWNPGLYPALTVTNGSAVVTGNNLPAAMCPYVANGSGIAIANSAIISGTGFQAGNKILITGSRFGQPYTGAFEFRADSPYQATLSVLWPGDSGSITWMVEGNESTQTFATIAINNVSDPRFGQIWACHWDNPSQITLNRPWVGSGTETVGFSRYNLIGRGTQAFILGIKTAQMSWGSLIDDSTTASSYRDLATGAANWIEDVGYDPLLKAVTYGRIFPQCEPPMTELGDPTFVFRIPGCIENSANPDAVSTARARNSEVQNAVRVAYQANPTGKVKALGDQMYCAQWGIATLTRPGYCTESITASNLADFNLAGYKWTGFFFGIGMAHQWPAVRVGGVSPPSPQSVTVNLDLSQAASARVTVTQPSSATAQYVCLASPCQVVVDARQGAHWAQIDYLSSTGQVLSRTQPYLLSTSTGNIPEALTPATVTLSPSQTVQFIATFSGTFNLGATWSISPPQGSVSATGLYTAPSSFSNPNSTLTVTATSIADPTRSATGLIFLTASGAVTANPRFNPGPGNYTSAQSVTISTSTPGALIRYTTDGSTPTSLTGTLYNGPVFVISSLTLRAISYENGMTNSAVSPAAYTIGGGGWSNGYGYRRTVTINHTKVPNTDQSNFPVLISSTFSDLATTGNGGSVTNANGYDIIFTSDAAGGNILASEQESYSASTGAVNYWVKVGTVSHTVDTVIYMFYGNTAVTSDQSNKTAVWDSGYKGVWHLSDNAASTMVAESTSNTNTGTNQRNTNTVTVTGQIGAGLSYDGTNDWTSTTLTNVLVSYTFEAWFKVASSADNSAAARIMDKNYSNGMWIGKDASGGASSWGGGTQEAGPPYGIYGSAIDGSWHHIASVHNGATHTIYIDGAYAVSNTVSSGGTASDTLYFAATNALGNKFKGSIDEVRASSVARSADWITAEYNNQNSPTTFAAFGGQETSGGSGQVAMPTFSPAAGTYSSAQSVTVSSTTLGASIRYTADGTTPSSTVGTVYGGAVSVSSSLTLKAIAYKTGMSDSTVATSAYSISAGGPAWFNRSWTNRKAVTVDHTKVSGGGSLTNFPMLFSVADAKLRTVDNGGSVGKTDGTDLLFTASDGITKLDHELEFYNASTGQVIAWVRLPSLSPSADTVVYVYYGNAAAADQQNKTAVWDSNYDLVWHLNAATGGTDSTINANHGTLEAAGKIDGAAEGVVEGVSGSVPSGDQTRSLDCWFRITGNFSSDQVICGMGYDSGTGTIFSLMYRAAGSTLSLDAKGIARSFSWISDSNWHHLAATYTSGSGLQNAAVYLDGVQQTTTGGTGTLATQSYTYVDVERSPAYPLDDMTGTVDEFRISSIARSAAWILTGFTNQSSPGTFFSVGGQQ